MVYSVAMEREYLSLAIEEVVAGMSAERSDEEVLAASVMHPHLFAEIVRKYEAPFLRKAQGIVHSEEEASDVVQEAFTKIYLNAAKFKKQEGASFSSWGYRILINTALTHYAKRKREGTYRMDIEPEIMELLPDKQLRQFEKKELTDEIVSVLSRMPESFARVLTHFFIDGKTQEEIAHTEGVTVGAVKTRVHRAKQEFRRIYETISTTI